MLAGLFYNHCLLHLLLLLLQQLLLLLLLLLLLILLFFILLCLISWENKQANKGKQTATLLE